MRARKPGQDLRSGIAERVGWVGAALQPMGPEEIVARLEDAGACLLAMPNLGYSTRMRQMRFDIVHTALEAYGWETAPIRAPAPDATAISAMDEAFGWLALIPEEKYVLRRVLGARSLVHPITRRHLFPWRRLGGVLGADHKSVQRWHGDAVGLLVRVFAAAGVRGKRDCAT